MPREAHWRTLASHLLPTKARSPSISRPQRPGDNAKLAPEQEQAHLNALREQRETKANLKLQAEAQNLAMTLGELALNDLPPKAKEMAAEKKFGGALVPATVSILLHAIVRNGVPPSEDAAGDKTPRSGGKKGGGGGKKGGSGVKPTKIVDKPPCTTAEARKAIKANKHLLKAAVTTPAAQMAMLRAVEWWLLSAHGSVALPGAAKVIEVLYDLDLASEDVLNQFWADVQSTVAREVAAMQQDEKTVAARRESEAAAAAEVKVYDAQEKDAARHKKQSEDYAQYTRCGGNPNQEEQAIEKQAIAQVRG